MLLPVELIKRVKREEGQYLEKSVQHRRRELQPLEINYRLTELGPIQMFSCWVYLTLS